MTVTSYSKLSIKNGQVTQESFITMINPNDDSIKNKMYNDLLSYCELDIFSMKLILDELKGILLK